MAKNGTMYKFNVSTMNGCNSSLPEFKERTSIFPKGLSFNIGVTTNDK